MTPGWRRWAAILTTYSCLLAGAIPYKIRVPPPGQLVALSGDDLRVELDLPPPGASGGGGAAVEEAPDASSRRKGGHGGGEGEAEAGAGARVRRDGELWIELVDMELGAERARVRRKMKKEEEEAEEEEGSGGVGRWRREGGSGDGEAVVVAGWNSVEVKGKVRDKEKKVGGKRYGWVAGGVRPKGEKENAVGVEGKEAAGAGRGPKWGWERRGGDRWGGKLRWRSWNGRVVAGGGGEAEGKGIEGAGGGRKGGEGEEGKKGVEGKVVEEGKGEKEEEDEGGGMILESALVSRGWHLPLSPPPHGHSGPSSPHSTLALTFPASHFTHGGLYVVRLVGTGRVVSNAQGTQRPQRDTTTTTTDGIQSVGKDLETVGRLEERNNTGRAARDSASYVNKEEGEVEEEVSTVTSGEGDKVVSSSSRRMFGRILEALENREKWEEYDRGAMVPSNRKLPEGGGASSGSRKKRTVGREGVASSGSKGQKTAKERKEVLLFQEGPRGGDGPSEVDGREKDLRRVLEREDRDHYGVSDYGEESSVEEEEERRGLEQWERSRLMGGGISQSWENRKSRGEGREEGRGVPGGGSESLEELASVAWGDGRGELSEESADKTRVTPWSVPGTHLEDKVREEESKDERIKKRRKRDYGIEGNENGGQKLRSKSHGLCRGAKKRGRRNEERGGEYHETAMNEESTEEEGKREIAGVDAGEDQTSRSRTVHDSGEVVERVEKQRDGGERSVGDSLGDLGEEASEEKAWKTLNGTAEMEGRVSREAPKGCRENCETTSRQILAEESVLVSWPTARFTLNILSSSSSMSASQVSKTKSEEPPRNMTFGTFEAPVRVLVEISCGVKGVGRRTKREVGGEVEMAEVDSGKEERKLGMRVDKDENNNLVGVSEVSIETPNNDSEESVSLKQGNQSGDMNGGMETKDFVDADWKGGEEEKGKPKRVRKGERGENERLWNDEESGMEAGEKGAKKKLKGEKNYAPSWNVGNHSKEDSEVKLGVIEGQVVEKEQVAPKARKGVKLRIRKERVTKYDITDDVMEKLEEKAGKLGSSGYAMKREAPALLEEEERDLEGIHVDGIWKRVLRVGRERRDLHRVARDETIQKASKTSGISRDSKTASLSPGPPNLPFRVFLVLRYCGVDSTECDEEEASKDDLEIWRRPQTVFTEELVDFPACPKYQHQVILPCEAFGQAGVYVVQVRSNYTLEEDESEKGAGGKEAEEERAGRRKRRMRDEGEGKESKEREETTPDASDFSAESFAGGNFIRGSGGVTITSKTNEDVDKRRSESGARIWKSANERSGSEERWSKESFHSGDGPEASGGGHRRDRRSPWEMGGDSWWEMGSGDGDGEDGGSGDAEYGDDPEGGSGDSSSSSTRKKNKLPDPPPRSLWSSSQSIFVHLSKGYVFTVHARSVFPCSDAHVRPETLEPAPSGVPVLFEYPECILEGSDRVRVFGRARPDVAAILPPFWMDTSGDAAVTLSHPSLRYVAEKKIYKGKHNAWFDCSLFTERFSEYCFAYASEATTGAVTHVRAQCIPTLPTSEEDRGGWGSWSPWSQCSTTCGSGSRNRYRTCDNPPPRYGAPFCEGTALETERCPPPSGVSYEELQEMCPLGLALSAGDDANRKGNEPNCRCGGCIVHLQGVAGSWGSRNAGPIKPRARLIASSSQACPGRSFWLLQAEPGHVVSLTVSSLLLPCPRRQWLKARDGDSLSSRLVLHMPSSAASNAPAFTTEALCFSSGPHLLLEFYSFERLEPTCNGGFLAHAHQLPANYSASAIGRDVLLTPTTRAVPRSSLSVHAAALAFILALIALSGGLAMNYVLRRRRFNEELKKREKEEEEMSDSDSDTKCFIARNKDGGSATSVTSVSDVISLRKLSVGKDGKRREVHMRLTEETDEDEEEDEEDEEEEEERGGERGGEGEEDGKGASRSTDHDEPAKANLPKVEVLHPGGEKGKRGRREREGEEGEEGGGGGAGVEVARRRKRKGAAVGRREWRESACPLLEQDTVAQSSISLPSSPTEALGEAVDPNAPGRPGLSASAPLLLRRSLSFFAATASASSAGAAGDSSPTEGVAQSISAVGKQWWRRKMQRFQNGSVSPVREELEETWRLAEPHSSPKKKTEAKWRPASSDVSSAAASPPPPAKESKEKQNRERLMRATAKVTRPRQPPPPSSTTPSDSPSATTSPEMSGAGERRLRGRLRARVDDRGKCTSEASLAGGASELDLEFDYYDYNVQNAGAAPGSYLGMDPAFLVYIPPFEGSTSPSSNASSASTLQAPPSEAGTDVLSPSPQPPGAAVVAGGVHRGEYYCINPSYARANFQQELGLNGPAGVNGGNGGVEEEAMCMREFRRGSSVEEEGKEGVEDDEEEEGRGSEKETRVEKSPVEGRRDVEGEEEDEEEIKFADEDEEEEEQAGIKTEAVKYGVIKAKDVGLRKPI